VAGDGDEAVALEALSEGADERRAGDRIGPRVGGEVDDRDRA
jgi:hypothetical protein